MTRSLGLYKSRLVPFAERWIAADAGYETPCHVWQWNVANSGYGRYGAEGTMWLAHRYAYVQANGEIPESLSIDHLCRNPLCVNPNHLEAVTLAENTRRQNIAVPPNKEPRCGHPQESHWAECRICGRARRKAYRDRQRASFHLGMEP